MKMKLKLTLLGIAAMLATSAPGAIYPFASWDSSLESPIVIPDGNPVGIAVQHTFSGGLTEGIASVDVRLNISGGYNGDLYGYLVLQSADNSVITAILLNRIGTSPSDAFGSSGSGFSSITLSDTGTVNGNIHNATGVPSGIWQAGQFSGVTSLNTSFGGCNANGTWTLFLADMCGGEVSSLVSWGLDISVVPEPATWAMIIFGSLVGVYASARRLRRQPAA